MTLKVYISLHNVSCQL